MSSGGTKCSMLKEFQEVFFFKGNPIENIEFFSNGNVNLISIDSFLVIQKREESFFQRL